MKPTDFSVHVTNFLTHYLAAQRNVVAGADPGGDADRKLTGAPPHPLALAIAAAIAHHAAL
ncbi:MAG: hypothetical protein HYU44_18515, partial [Betaproteobacteria bacterium]|nr:hypothetical protein [Betaproteobacteria bacterium]